jgi:hypothetical protein
MAFSDNVRFLSTLSSASGHQRCSLAGVPPQPNSRSGGCPKNFQGRYCPFDQNDPRLGDTLSIWCTKQLLWTERRPLRTSSPHPIPRERAVGQQQSGSYSVSKVTVKVVVFHCRRKLPPLLHPSCHCTASNWSQTQQGLLSPLTPTSPFPCLVASLSSSWGQSH